MCKIAVTKDLACYTSGSIGFSDSVDKQLLDTADMSQERYRYIGLVLDEVHIKADLVYDKHEGALVGFVNLGDINNHLLQFESVLSGDGQPHQLANSMIVLMVRALFYNFNFPYVQFACGNLSGNLLMNPVWEAIFRLERMGFFVLTFTCDGASTNRRLWKLHSNDELVYKVPNVYAPERSLYFL